jgi:acetyltransferase-like isoleucine patch superfamily enzyme
MPLIDSRAKEILKSHRVGCLHSSNFRLPEDCVFEPPCSIKWIRADHSLSLGAFSYAVSGYYFAARIARYVSIGEEVQVGRHSHPTHWSSTSPLFSRDHAAVFDFALPEAANIKPRDFMLGRPQQQVRITNIGNDVWIGHGAFIGPGVSIGDGAVVGAYAVVTKDIPPYAVAAGVPAVVKKMRFSDATVERMLSVKWWRFAFWDLVGASATEPEKFLGTIEDKIASGALKEYYPEKIQLSDILKT